MLTGEPVGAGQASGEEPEDIGFLAHFMIGPLERVAMVKIKLLDSASVPA
jgi:hypothetical protein